MVKIKEGPLKLWVISLLVILSFTRVSGQDTGTSYQQIMQNAANILQQQGTGNQLTELQKFILESALSSMFPQLDAGNLVEILQSINGGNFPFPQVNVSDLIENIFERLTTSPTLKNVSSTIIKELLENMDFSMLKNLTNGNDVIPNIIKNLLQNMDRNITYQDLLNSGLFNMFNETFNEFSKYFGFMNKNRSISSPSESFPVSSACANDLQLFLKGLTSQQMWAFRMIDAMGKPVPGILDGAIQMTGDYDECIRITTSTQAPFNGKYCSLKLPLTGMMAMFGLLNFGVCMPKSCSASDTTNAFNSFLTKVNMQVYYTECQEEKEYDARAIAVLCICGIFVALMIIATLFDIVFVIPKIKKSTKKKYIKDDTKPEETTKDTKPEELAEPKLYGDVIKAVAQLNNGFVPDENEAKVNLDNEKNDVNFENHSETKELDASKLNNASVWFTYKPNSEESENKSKPEKATYKPGLLASLLLSFSVYTNGKKLLSTKQAGGTLGSVNGIRFISMTWVILGHSISFSLGAMKNVGYAMPAFLQRWTFMAISNALLSVDTFFALSGMLLTYLFMKEMKRERGRINWFMFYFHRFWRLTPPYMLVMLVNISLSKYFSDGPNYPKDGLELNYCEGTWWRNLLYINNFFPGAEMCFGWSWYLANDMQFYIISPLMLVPLYLSEKIGGVVVVLFMLGATITAIAISAALELPATIVSLATFGVENSYFDAYYVRPYCRMGPYIVGIITGYMLYKTDCKAKINKLVNIFVWLMAAVFACVVLYGTYEESKGNAMSVPLAALYNGTHRTIWGACVCWVVFACCNGYGGFVNTLLSWKAFIPLGRLTYCAFLVHPIIMYTYIYSMRIYSYANEITFGFTSDQQQRSFTDEKSEKRRRNQTYDYLANAVLAYAVAFVTSLAFESPMMALEKAIFKRGKK